MGQDLVNKRRSLAREIIIRAGQLNDSIIKLTNLAIEKSKLGDFEQSDFDGQAELLHLTPDLIGTLTDFVVPSMYAAYVDTGNGERNKQILIQTKSV